MILGAAYTAAAPVDGFIRTPKGKLTLFGLTGVDPTHGAINDLNEVIPDYFVEVQQPPPNNGQTLVRYDFVRRHDGKIGIYDPPSTPGSLQGYAIHDLGVIAGQSGPNGLFLLTPKN